MDLRALLPGLALFTGGLLSFLSARAQMRAIAKTFENPEDVKNHVIMVRVRWSMVVAVLGVLLTAAGAVGHLPR